MGQPQVILYDIIVNSASGKRQASSPNTWKIRLALNYKGVPYKTVWVEYADVQKACVAIGAEATGKMGNGTTRYTLPTIMIPATGEIISDSHKIITYLEEHFPEKPLFPLGKAQEQLAYESQLFPIIGMEFAVPMTYRAYHKMLPTSAAALERAVRDTFGTPPFKDIPPPNSDSIRAIEQALSTLAATYQGQPYLFGNTITYADLVVAAYLVALTRSLTDDEMVLFRSWDAVKWFKMVEQFEALGYYAEDEGELYH